MKRGFIPVILILVSALSISACSSTTSSTPVATTPAVTTNPVTSTAVTTAPVTTTATTTKPATATAAAATAAPTTTTQARYGGVFRQIETASPVNVGDPAVVPSMPTFYRVAGESLFYVEPDGTPVPRLATSWDFDPNGKYVVFHLRKGVKFQDGTDFNAQAAKFCLERGKNGQAPGLKPVTSIEVVDDYTVKVNWPTFDYSVWETLGGHKAPSWMISPTSIQTHDKDWPLLNVVATGAFKLVSYDRDVSMKFERFADYWQKGLPFLDGVQFIFIADQTTGLLSFKSGAAEMLRSLTKAGADDLKKDGIYNVVQTPGNSIYMAFSSKTAGSPFTDLKVRQAVCYAVDSKAIAQGIGGSYYLPSNQAFTPWQWGYSPDVKGYPYDPARAKQLLAEAGYPNGFKTSIFMQAGYTDSQMPVAVQAYLKAVGIEAEIKLQTPPAIAAMMSNTGWDGLMTSQLMNLIGGDPAAGMQGNGFVNRGTYYYSVMRTDDTQDLINKVNASPDRSKREPLLKQLSQLVIDKYAMILPIYYTQNLIAFQPYVRDIGWDQFSYTYEKAWLSK